MKEMNRPVVDSCRHLFYIDGEGKSPGHVMYPEKEVQGERAASYRKEYVVGESPRRALMSF